MMSDNLQRRWVTSSFNSPDEIEGSFLFVRRLKFLNMGG